MADGALVLFSAGQDSATCLAWALTRYAHVETIGFAYGQRHAVELQQRPILREHIASLSLGGELGGDVVVDLAGYGGNLEHWASLQHIAGTGARQIRLAPAAMHNRQGSACGPRAGPQGGQPESEAPPPGALVLRLSMSAHGVGLSFRRLRPARPSSVLCAESPFRRHLSQTTRGRFCLSTGDLNESE